MRTVLLLFLSTFCAQAQSGSSMMTYFTPAGTSLGDNLWIGGGGNYTLSAGTGSTWFASRNLGIGRNVLGAGTTGFYNTACGWGAMAVNTSGNCDTAYGYLSLNANTVGQYNTGLGAWALFHLNYGNENTGVGPDSGFNLIRGWQNTLVGNMSLFSNTNGSQNIAIGSWVGYAQKTGNQNTFIGVGCFSNSPAGNRNIGLGYSAGKYETGDDMLYVDNRDRANSAGDRTKALIVGRMDSEPTNQWLKVNGKLILTSPDGKSFTLQVNNDGSLDVKSTQ